MQKETKRILTLLLALALCLGLLPMTALAEEAKPKGPFTITFDASPGKFSDGSVTEEIQTQILESGDNRLFVVASNPVREGYKFVGWYVDSPDETTSTYNRVYTADTTVHARWIEEKEESGAGKVFDVIFDAHPGVFLPNNTTVMTVQTTGPKVTPPKEVPVYSGHTFDGWYTQDGKPVSDAAFTGMTSVVAKWTPNTETSAGFRVDFFPNGGTIASIRGIPAKDLRPGNAQADKTQTFVDPYSGVGMIQTDASGILDCFPEISREGYTFDGWYIVSGSDLGSNDNEEITIPSGAKEVVLNTAYKSDTYLAAKWTKSGASSQESKDGPFTVKFDLNYKNPKASEVPKEQKLNKGQTVDLPNGKKLTCPSTSLEFYAWCMKGEDGKLYPWTPSAGVTADMTLYAGWVKKGTAVKDGQALPEATEPSKPAQNPAATVVTDFHDVPANSPFLDSIVWAVKQGITNGKTATAFGPGDPCTRAQIVTFLWRAAGSPEPKLTETQYVDVTDPGAYYYKAVQWAAELGMEHSGTFDPHDTCTRVTAVYFIWTAFGRPAPTAKASFEDVREPERGQWYWPDLPDAVDWAVERGVTTGKTATTFAPGDPCTRGQIVTFLYRAYVK